MKKLALGALCLGFLAACGGGDDDDSVTPMTDASVDAVVVADCNPLAAAGMQGCATGQKCTWITITADDPQTAADEGVGKTGCVADGTVDLAGSCTVGAPGEATGFDNCKAGNICVNSTCKDICGFGGGAQEACASGQACTRYASLFANGEDDPLYGACNPTCNPVTQLRSDGSNCGANQGCYLLVSSTTTTAVCAGAGTVTHNTTITGTAFANSCVPGAQPRRTSEADMSTQCGGLCAPKDVFVKVPGDVMFNPANDMAAPVPITDAAKVENLAAEAGDRAVRHCGMNSGGSMTGWGGAGPEVPNQGESCRYWWAREPFDELSPFSNTVGWCFKHAAFRYDSDANMAADHPFPRCNALPGCTTAGCTTADRVLPIGNPPHEDASFFWCRALPAMLQTSVRHVKKNIEHQEPKLDRMSDWR